MMHLAVGNAQTHCSCGLPMDSGRSTTKTAAVGYPPDGSLSARAAILF
jgi:hypothetical protein